ncbi:MAG: DNA translocase FtsK, partial [Desulfobacter sp.]|nr:DNA translocase FtsK [Desulfobacter sp.]
MENKNYSLEKNLLCLRTECGEYKFQISGETGQGDAERIAKVMTGEMEKADNAFGRQSKPNPYVKLLLANLNLADKYVKLQNRYDELLKAHEASKIRHANPVDALASPEPTPLKSDEKKPLTGQDANQDDDSPGVTLEFESCAPDLPTPEISDTPPMESDREESGENKAQAPASPGPLVTQVLDTLKKAKEIESEPLEEPETEPLETPESIPESKVKKTDSVQPDSTNQTDEPLARANVQDNGDGTFRLPSLDFLEKGGQETVVDHEAIRRDAELLEQKLGYFGIKGEVMEVLPGPVITTFEYKPAPGIKISKIVNLADDLALALSALSIRIVAPIPGKDVIGIEIPNPAMCVVPFRDIVGAPAFPEINSPAPICLGKDIIGKPVVVGLERMP